MKPETLTLLLAVLAFVVYFGPAALRLILRPERGSVTDLRIARYEALLADFDKRARVGEKLEKRLAEDKARASAGEATTTTLASIVVDVIASKADEPPSVTTTVSVSTDPAAAAAPTEKDPRP